MNNDVTNPLAPASLEFPQYKAHLIIGAIDKETGQLTPAKISLHQPQVLRFLKVMERIGIYNEFKEGTITEFMKHKLSPQDKQKYLAAFIQYLNLSNELEKEKNKNKKELTQAQEMSRKKMRDIEDTVDHKQIIELRNQGHERVRSEDGRQSALDKIEEEIQAEISNKVGYGLFISSKSKMKIERDIRNSYQPRIDAVKSSYDQEQSEISENIQNLLMDLKDDGQEEEGEDHDYSLLPDRYVSLELRMDIPLLEFSLVNEFAQKLFNVKLVEFDIQFEQAKHRQLT